MLTYTPQSKQTLAHHLGELRKRLAIIALVFIVAVIAAYQIHEGIISVLQRPLHETLYFTSPGGGFNFVLKVCMLVAFLAASPIIILQIIRFVEPVLPPKGRAIVLRYMAASVTLILAGVLFAYFVTLPAALDFLAHFGGKEVESLISANEYMNFVMAYLIGFGLLFQIPIIVLFINRIKPIPPRTLLRASRPVIVGAFIMAAILTPTPDPVNQGLMAGPIIGMYGLSTAMVMVSSGRHKRLDSKHMRQVKQVPFSPPVPLPSSPAAPAVATSERTNALGTLPSSTPTDISAAASSLIPSLAPRQFLDLRPPLASSAPSASAVHNPVSQPRQVPHPIPAQRTPQHRGGPTFMDIRPAEGLSTSN